MTPTAPDDFAFLRQYVHTGSGIVLESEKEYLLEARLAPVLRDSGLRSLHDLCEVLKLSQTSPLHREVVEAMTTHETYFFREPAHYTALREQILPGLMD